MLATQKNRLKSNETCPFLGRWFVEEQNHEKKHSKRRETFKKNIKKPNESFEAYTNKIYDSKQRGDQTESSFLF